jgi:hypothetical protein
MPFGVLTYPQLRRELKRCRELGKPWPFVLAVIPSSSNRRVVRIQRHVSLSLAPALPEAAQNAAAAAGI